MGAPGIDRHVHLEGGLSPDWVRDQAALRHLPVPPPAERLWQGESVAFSDFIEAFLFPSRLISSPEAVRLAIHACVDRLGTEEPRGLDLWVSPHFLVRHRQIITLDQLWQGLDQGIQEVRQKGVRVAVIIDAVNHLGIAHGHEVLDLVLPNLPEWVVGFSTGGLEQVPFRLWAEVFHRARKAGLRIAAHAGENGPGRHVAEAVLEGGVERIVHGVHAATDPAILALLAERKIPVDICLSSNMALVPDLGRHPLPQMLAAGVRCALGTDDPGVIPCDMPGEWHKAAALLAPENLDSLRRHAQEDAWCLLRP